MANQQGGRGSDDKGRSTQGGTPEQHAEAGRLSHKNDDSSGSRPDNSKGGTRGGTSEQHAEAGRQSHKNDDKGGAGSGRGGDR